MSLYINGRFVLPTQDYIKFDTTGQTTTNEQGALYWDNQDNTLTVPLDGEDVKLQLGQEILIRCVNRTASQINNGQVVYISGVHGHRPTIGLADANIMATASKVIGIATENISINEYGFITTFGVVRDLNTNVAGYNEGDVLYLSETAGEFTNVAPTLPVPNVKIGVLTKKHNNDGWIQVSIHNQRDIFGDYDNGNYSYFDSNGFLTYKGDTTFWLDLDFPIIVRTTGPNIPALTTVQGNITAPEWEVNDLNVCEGQELTHRWKEASDIHWHVHMITNGSNVTDRFVKWEIEYFYAVVGSQISANTTVTYEYTIPANTPSKTMLIVPIATVSLPDAKISSHLYARLRRIASTGTAPTLNPWCTMLQAHIECDTLGSKEVTSK